MKQYLIIAAFLHITFSSFSQSFKVGYSDEFKIVEKFNRDKVFKSAILYHNNIYSVINPHVAGAGKWLFTKLFDFSYSLRVSKYDRNMNVIKEFDLDNGSSDFAPIEPVLIDFNGTLVMAYYKPFDKKAFDLYLSVVDPESLQLSQPVKIMSVPVENVGLLKVEKELDNLNIKFELSPNKTKLLLTGMVKDNEAAIFVLNNRLEVERQTKVHLPGSKYSLTSAVISNSDFVCMSFSSGEDDNLIIALSANGNKTESKIKGLSDGLVPNESYLKLSKDQSTVYIYSTASASKQDYKYSKGLLVTAIDTLNPKAPKPMLYEFGADFYQAMCDKGGGNKHRKEQRVFNFMPRLTELDNGNILVYGSPQISTSQSQTVLSTPMMGSNGMSGMNASPTTKTYTRSTYEAGSIVSFLINKNTAQYTYSVIPRDIIISRTDTRSGSVQIIQSPWISHNFSGFFVTELKDKIVFIYDDCAKNIERDLNDKTYSVTSLQPNYALAEAAIDKNGKILYRTKLADDPKGAYTFYMSESIIGNNNSYLIPIAKQGTGFNGMREFYNKWCILELMP
jgi:hypothetical protein